MAEKSERGLRGFIRRLTGQAARDVQLAEQQAQQQRMREEAAAARLVQLQTNAENLRRRLEAATSIERINLPNRDIDYQTEAAQIEDSVQARAISGKFHPVQIKGRIIVPYESNDFNVYGDVAAIPDPLGTAASHPYVRPPGIVENVLLINPYNLGDLEKFFKQIRKKHFVGVVNAPDSQNALVSYFFLHDHIDRTGRPSGMAMVNFLLQKQSAYRLLALIRKNPEVAEMFLQRAAQGFERSATGQPGIGRIQSDEIIMVNYGNFNLDYFNHFIDPWSRRLIDGLADGNLIQGVGPKIIADMQTNKNGQIERYKYATPHGIVDPSVIR